MRYSTIREMDVSNGKGVGVALFVQGCHFHCPGCFNQETWDFNGGKEWTDEICECFLNLADRPYIKRISILGGEPLANENLDDVWDLINKIVHRFGTTKQIWLYSGYTWDEIMNIPEYTNPETYKLHQRRDIVSNCDVLVDGNFDITKQDLFNKTIVWAGSTNQRVIDVQQSIISNEIITI